MKYLDSSRHLKLLMAWVALAVGSVAQSPTMLRVSVATGGTQSNGAAYMPSISADGRYITFSSGANNLVVGDTNGVWDVFVHDRVSATTERLSVDSTGLQGNSDSSSYAVLSGDGRYVAFTSGATNLVPGDTNLALDIFVRDRQNSTTERVSVDSGGAQGNGSSSFYVSISADGRYVAFNSYATNLVPGDTNLALDIFVRDRQNSTTERVSVDSGGAQGNGSSGEPSISADGRYVAFESDSTNLVAGDTNGKVDVFVYDRQTSALSSVTVDPNWVIGNGQSFTSSISADGRFVAFMSDATNLVPGDTNLLIDIFLYDRQAPVATAMSRVSVDSAGNQASGSSWVPVVSGDGRYVAFYSPATDLVAGDTNGQVDVFVHDNQTGATSRLESRGTQGNAEIVYPSMSHDGRFVTFQSYATNLVPGDTNGVPDVFVYDPLLCGGYTQYCTGKVNSQGCLPSMCASGSPSLSGPENFYVTAQYVLNNKTGILLWSLGQASIPFYGGTLCLASPIRRTPPQDSGGTVGVNNCTGAYSFLFGGTYIANQGLAVATLIYAQYWSRDPFLAPPNNVGLTNGLEFVIGP